MQQKTEPIWSDNQVGEVCDTLFYQGNNTSQTQALKYVGDYKITATTGETMWCTGRNNLLPLYVIYKLHIGCEIMDVNLNLFNSYSSLLNPLNWFSYTKSSFINWYYGNHFTPAQVTNSGTVKYHGPVISQYSFGQETDILSHEEKYRCWKERKDKSDGLILWGVSRGTAATFCAFAKNKYKDVKLVVLEGAVDSIPNVLHNMLAQFVSNDKAKFLMRGVNNVFSFFNHYKFIKYSPDGISPLQCVNNFPEGVPVVFITSKKDMTVSCANTENLAQALVKKGKNDVYLLKLQHSSHPSYMFDDLEDRTNYESFIHAIYRKYNLKHNPELADQGEKFLKEATLNEVELEKENIMPQMSY